jgi:hypothetical protein
MFLITTFNFNKYPKLLEMYIELDELRTKYGKAVTAGKGTIEMYNEVKKAEASPEMAIHIFKLFNGVVKYVQHETKGKMKWSDVFGNDISALTKEQMEDLIGLIDGNFIYRLPTEYYE